MGFTDRIGVVHEFDYDGLGRQTPDGIVGGAMQRIDREGDAVTLTTGGGRPATWGSDGTTGERTQRYTDASGVYVERSRQRRGRTDHALRRRLLEIAVGVAPRRPDP